jgi:hypothetical protein
LLETEEIPGTPTPTPIPTQTGEFNIPIVLGVVAIITIILFAWAIVGGSKH